jgi:formylglycine-generating enzyme required for sulfatase activity
MLLGTRNSEFDDAVPKLHARRSGMIFIPGGTFQMGSDKHYPQEAPAHRVTVGGFWMDATPVTNAQFRGFVESTGYVTFAEITPDANDYPSACRDREISRDLQGIPAQPTPGEFLRRWTHGEHASGSRSVDRTLAAAEAPVRTSSAAILSESLFLPFV